MHVKQIISEEVRKILSEEQAAQGLAQLDQIVDAAPQVIPELEKFVNDNILAFLKHTLKNAEPLAEGEDELSDKIAAPIQKGLRTGGQVAKGLAKGTAPVSVPALKLAGHVGSFLPFGKKAGVLIAAAQDKNTPEAVRNAILFALTNLLAGQLGMELPDLSSLIQMVPGIPDFESAVLHSIDDVTLLGWAWRKMTKAGIDPKHQLKRFGEFIGRADIVDLGEDPAAVPAGPGGFDPNDKSLDAKIARANALAKKGSNFRGVKEMRIKTSELYQLIREELEVILTNEEAEEVFNLDMSALLDEMMSEDEDKDWIQDAEADIERRGTEGVCTGEKFGSESCPPGSKRYNLAKTFRKMAKKRKKD